MRGDGPCARLYVTSLTTGHIMPAGGSVVKLFPAIKHHRKTATNPSLCNIYDVVYPILRQDLAGRGLVELGPLG
jgi:hypothetical protein